MNKFIESAKEITIVIITHNRYPFLSRLLKFYDCYSEKFHFLILDSSSQRPEKSLLKYFKRDNVDYHKFDPNIFFATKIAEGSKHIKTKYAVCCADDDFLIPSGIINSKEYLEKNSNYASAHGLYFNHINPNNINIFRRFNLTPLYERGKSSEEESGLNRIISYFGGITKYLPMYAVHRTDLFQKVWSETNEYVSDWGLSELFPSALSLAHGKMKVLPIFYASREPNTYAWVNKDKFSKIYSSSKVNKTIQGLSKNIHLIDKISEIYARKCIKNAIQNRLKDDSLETAKDHQKKLLSLVKSKLELRNRFGSLIGLNTLDKEFLKDYIFVKKAVIGAGDLGAELKKTRQEYAN